MIGWLVKKPGAFRRYRYRDALFPTATYRRAWDRLDDALSTWSADMNYLQILKLAREAGQEDVGWVLATLLDAGTLPRFDSVVEAMDRKKPEAPELTAPQVEIGTYDELTPTTREEVGR